MSYPYGPQGVPGGQQPNPYGPQPGGYPQQPYAQPGHTPYGGPGGYPGMPETGGTAKAAGGLALLLAALGLIGSIMSFSAISRLEDATKSLSKYTGSSAGADTGFLYFLAIVGLLIAALWALGGALLLMRKQAGRVILIAVAGIGGLLNLVGAINAAKYGVNSATSWIGLLIAALIIALCLVSSTTRWLATAPGRAMPPAYGRPAAPYGQPVAPYGAPYGQAPYGQPVPPPANPYGQQQYPPRY
ncbi:DUF5336 domain-containing protein [Nocardia sp. XZ_19_385]|uniref:DUF5336 domain-containing protein n=1 Tax=Nocardia sp. XZ_19_385 TaxID=2769488 RepID=UPI00189018CB|nr:DUF5336 domain-containing protein [Nocardia sp. XZ_19_385]